MVMYKISGDEVGKFMSQLFKDSVLDHFEVRGMEVMSFTRIDISGEAVGYEAPDTNKPTYLSWGVLRPFAVNLIKGKVRPRLLRLTLSLPAASVEAIHSNARTLVMNIAYDSATDEVKITSAVSPKEFIQDKSLEYAWDDYLEEFIKDKKIIITEKL